MPAFNEEASIERAVREAVAAASGLVPSYEVVVVDDGSHDATGEQLSHLGKELGDRLVVVRHAENRGYGTALRDGFAAARGRLVFYTDADNQFDLRELVSAMPLVTEYDAVLGFRLDRQDPWMRRFVSGVFNRIARVALGAAARDLNCSFKLFRVETLRSLPLASEDFFIDTEIVALLRWAGARCVERGVRHLPRVAGRSTVRPGDVPRTLSSLARFWWRLRRLPTPRARA
jgi:glycosyltransferase involved in cell wall biosynthesis